MEEAKGLVKHVLLARFNDDTTPDQIEELIRGFANLVNLVPSMKSFHWGRDVSIENAIKASPMFSRRRSRAPRDSGVLTSSGPHLVLETVPPRLDKVLVVDFKPTSVRT
ncbi:Hexosyltransferase [Psidium guajava]|nr:Hexosyltransferase [Psidium guajava]